ncbi:MAG TPA: S1 RNA-binding domain-containing protein [Anaerolineaceae bacterium]|nr:S1 RNA-binding domain-containing protein [Anaerolineaceae bacterium]
MLSKSVENHLENGTPEIDEGWWAAVLTDEGSSQIILKETQAKPVATCTTKLDWDHVKSLYDHDEVIELQVHGYNRGGLLVQGPGIQGFVPVSHLVEMPGQASEEERRQILIKYVGRGLCLKVIECEPSQERIVLSERAALAGEGRRKQLFQQLKPGEIVSGSVTNVTEFGVFVDLGGVEGLIHVSELSWGRVQHPCDILQVGQIVQTQVLQISEENARVALSLKRLNSNPWETLIKKYKPGDVVAATVTSVMRFGAFARLEEGVEGLIHISSINMPPGVKEIEKILHVDQHVQVRILHIEIERRRLGLGLVNAE